MSGEWVPLPALSVLFWPPTEEDRRAWVAHYERCIAKDGLDATREDVAWTWRDEHPWIREFHREAVELAIRRAGTPAGWRDVENWDEHDFREHIRIDQDEGRRGSYRSLADRIEGWTASPLLRRWQKVSGGKSWPSGNRK